MRTSASCILTAIRRSFQAAAIAAVIGSFNFAMAAPNDDLRSVQSDLKILDLFAGEPSGLLDEETIIVLRVLLKKSTIDLADIPKALETVGLLKSMSALSLAMDAGLRQRRLAITDFRSWAAPSSLTLVGALPDMDLERFSWFLQVFMQGTTPIPLFANEGGYTVAFYNPVIDAVLFTRIARDPESLLDAFLLPGESVRNELDIAALPRWIKEPTYVDGIIRSTQATMQSLFGARQLTPDPFPYFQRELARISGNETLQARLLKFTYAAHDDYLGCGTQISAAAANPRQHIASAKFGNASQDLGAIEAAGPLLSVGGFKGSDYYVRFYQPTERPGMLVSIGASASDCAIVESYGMTLESIITHMK